LNTAPKNDVIPEPWLSFLRDLDSAATKEIRMDCMGGFVMTLVYGFSRTTGDLDVLELVPKEAGQTLLELGMEGGALHKKRKIYLHYVAVANVPDDYERRMTELFPETFRHLRLFGLDPYDLALSKLERNNQRDRDDVFHLARVVPFDLNVLQARYQKEMRYKMGRPEREDNTLRLWIDVIQEERSKKS
jgi:hypothetical protein